MEIDLTSQHILVTGASRGIGAAIVRQLLNSGARVSGQYSNTEFKDLLKHEKLHWLKADFNDPNSVLELAENCLKGRPLHGLVNNAGIAIHSNLNETDGEWLKKWEKTIRVNLTSTALLCKKLIPHFQKQENGRIVNITSRAAFRGDTTEFIAYAASKGGLVSLTRSLARAYGKDNIKVFNIAPGFTMTDMALDFAKHYGEEFITKDQALKDITRPEDIAPIVVFLLSGKADHATGTTIDVNAGSYIR